MSEERKTPAETGAAGAAQKPRQSKKKGSALKTLLKVIIWLAVIALIIFVTLFLASKIGHFDSIPALIDYIRAQVGW